MRASQPVRQRSTRVRKRVEIVSSSWTGRLCSRSTFFQSYSCMASKAPSAMTTVARGLPSAIRWDRRSATAGIDHSTSGTMQISAPVPAAALSAMSPQWRPMTSTTAGRSWERLVARMARMASTQELTALS